MSSKVPIPMPIEDLIYDVGMNNGDDTAYYLSLGFRVVAIDANPELVERAKSRFANEIASQRLIILNVGIADREGQLPFWICDANSRWSSFNRAYASWGNSPNHPIQVPCTRFETIVAQYGVPLFCKIDIQGNDCLCLEGFNAHHVPKFLSIEALNLDLQLLDKLAALGYSLFKCIEQSTFLPMQFPPVPEQHAARARQVVTRQFKISASGLSKTRRPSLAAEATSERASLPWLAFSASKFRGIW